MLDGLAEAAVRSLLLASAVQCALWLLRVRRPHTLLAAWTVVLAASLAMPMVQHLTPLRVPLDPALPGAVIDSASELLPWPSRQDLPGPTGIDPRPQPSTTSWVAAIYLAVSAGILLRVALGLCLAVRLLSRARPISRDWTRDARVRISREVTGPVTVANVILLPPDAPDWPIETRRAVLAHEQAHVQRWDFAMLILSQLNRGLFWFSPVPWWLHRRLVALTELASDDHAMACLRDPLRYAENLLEMGRRAGPVPPGPAMARPATLSQRIDRILQHPAPCAPARPHQAMIATGVAGLAFAVASAMPHPAPMPAIDGSAVTWDFSDEHPPQVAEASGSGTAGPANRQAQETAASVSALQVGSGSVAGARPAPTPVVLRPDGAASGTPQPRSRPSQQASQRVAPTASGNTLPAPRMVAKEAPDIPARNRPRDEAWPAEPIRDRMQPPTAGGTGAPPANGSPAADLVQHLPYPAVQPHGPVPFLPPEFRHIMGTSCDGTVAIGPNTTSSLTTQPFVVPGQKVPARAHFRLRTDGTAWVRFDSFGQRPLDLPVHFTRNGMTWTGEFGVAYTVQASGEHSLTGLAAFFRKDSARLDFTCG